jgi:hypothetical protein
MNPMKDAIAAVFGWDWETMAEAEKGLILKAAHELCVAHVDPADVPHIHAYCASKYDHFKPAALSGNLSDARKWNNPAQRASVSTAPPRAEDLTARADDFMTFDSEGHYIGTDKAVA